ncbi:MAG: DUF4150 domain-containing protein [Polyangiaceae bacterium]|nr:DUF4150 domain-containing protein [Polyangiaceae bacterium]
MLDADAAGPVPAPGILLPYPNMASHTGAKKTTTKVLVRNKKCLVEGSFIPKSTGDEPGCNQPTPMGKMGMKSRKQMGKCEFSSHSSKVKMEGKGVIFHTASTKHNDGNTVGKHGVPSQRVVLVAK